MEVRTEETSVQKIEETRKEGYRWEKEELKEERMKEGKREGSANGRKEATFKEGRTGGV